MAEAAKEQTNPIASRPVRCIVKLGGAAITNKGELESIDVESLRSACAQLRQAMSHASAAEKVVGMDWSRRPGDPIDDAVVDAEGLSEMEGLGLDTNFIVVHGAGSFGHFQASRSRVHKGGLHSTLVKAGFVATRISVTSLNQEIVRALAREGIPSVGMSPFSCGWSTKQRNLASANASQIIESLRVGLVPVLHGDAVLDELLTRIQYALNIEQFDVAKQLREKLTEIETEIIRQREAKRGSSKTEAQDKAINLLRVSADLQKAVDSENYALAASLRDEIAKLEAESLAVSAKALAYQNVKYVFRLGQKVRHKVHGYRAVICGMDPVCCESKSWMETANVENLSKGPNQPFYQVLVDVYADPELLVAYVAEENLAEAEVSEKGRFDHPYIEFLFFGEDTAGDFIPIKQLREKYDQPRYEASGDEDDDDDSTDS
ncbi:hypothetical protein E2562_002974 [Oryza meyeriana var. granulata]|uniref:Hemimethylated DNA-binding domain-containing protein n=1 Tax=Oryza meyeriana var. granulata TaxID=110450 RepID=A0A6G1DCK0_9ORYZ|nr:hypothetical protein E2562_002974 [Oryza meyeriana var. granulata]